MNTAIITLTLGIWMVTAIAVFTGMSVVFPTNVKGDVTSSSSPDSYEEYPHHVPDLRFH